MMKILQTTTFRRQVKKLHPNQKKELDEAVGKIADNPAVGEGKKGTLAGVRVYKFFMIGQLTLLAYTYDEDDDKLLLLALGSHENFYRDLTIA